MKAEERKNLYDNLNVRDFVASDDVRAFVGKNYDEYSDIWLSDYAKKHEPRGVIFSLHFNLLALVITPAWFAYRKMYKVWAALLAFMCVISFIEAAMHQDLPVGAYIGAFVALSITSKGLYFGHVLEEMHKIKNYSEAGKQKYIQRFGGVSVMQSIILMIIYLAILLGVQILGEKIWPPLNNYIAWPSE